jgi:hypothetical protein
LSGEGGGGGVVEKEEEGWWRRRESRGRLMSHQPSPVVRDFLSKTWGERRLYGCGGFAHTDKIWGFLRVVLS